MSLKIRPDLVKHFAVGLAFGVLTYFSWVFFVVASAVFIGKEVYDKYKDNPTGFDWLDLIADYLGLIAGLILTIQLWDYLKIY